MWFVHSCVLFWFVYCIMAWSPYSSVTETTRRRLATGSSKGQSTTKQLSCMLPLPPMMALGLSSSSSSSISSETERPHPSTSKPSWRLGVVPKGTSCIVVVGLPLPLALPLPWHCNWPWHPATSSQPGRYLHDTSCTWSASSGRRPCRLHRLPRAASTSGRRTWPGDTLDYFALRALGRAAGRCQLLLVAVACLVASWTVLDTHTVTHTL